jgi:hypothetical protein
VSVSQDRHRSLRALELFRTPKSASILGADHPLARTAALAHVVTRQVVATSGALAVGVVAVAEGRMWGWRLFGAACLVEMTLLGIAVSVRQARREHVLRLIATGLARLPLEEVSREAGRLASPGHAQQLATRLERTFQDASRWYEFAIVSRPPAGIRALCLFGAEVDAILEQLRDRPGLPGLASLELMLIGTGESALYAGDESALREQLWRIRCLLSPDV